MSQWRALTSWSCRALLRGSVPGPPSLYGAAGSGRGTCPWVPAPGLHDHLPHLVLSEPRRMFREVGALLLDHLSLATWTGREVVVVDGSLTGLAVLLLESPLVHHGQELVVVPLIRPPLAGKQKVVQQVTTKLWRQFPFRLLSAISMVEGFKRKISDM